MSFGSNKASKKNSPDKRPRDERRSFAFLWAGLMFVLPNLLLGLISAKLSLNRPLVNLDYGIVILLLVMRRPILSVIALAVVIGLDIITTALPVFFILGEALTLKVIVASIRVLNPIFSAVAAAGTFLISATFIRFLHTRRMIPLRWKASIAVVILLMVLFASMDLLNGSSRFRKTGTLIVHTNVAFSALHRLIIRSIGDASASAEVELVSASASATSRYLISRGKGGDDDGMSTPDFALAEQVAVHSQGEGRNLLIVMVESLGQLKDDAVNRALLAPILALKDQYSIEQGEIPANGATLAAEYRELLWLRIHDLGDHTGKHRSIPGVFAAAGYETVAIHGFLSQMFDRRIFYRSLGFSRSVFLEDIAGQESNVELQGVLLRGLPDHRAAEAVKQELTADRAGKPKLIYWLTLSSHLPVDTKYAQNLRPVVSREDYSALPDTIHAHLAILSDVITTVAAIARDPACGKLDIILVGDHPPPFGTGELRRQYNGGIVPYFLLLGK